MLSKFAAGLRRVRELAGRPSYRELSRRAHYSPAALSQAAAGHKLPSLAVTIAYVTACEGDVAAWEARWREVAAELTTDTDLAQREGDVADSRAPYVGLGAFQPDDAERFFGREKLVADLLRRMRTNRFVGVFGASGSGKSSLLRAGVAATVMKDGLFDRGPRQPMVLLTPGRHPREECAVQLAELTGYPVSAVAAEFAGDPGMLHLWVRQVLAGHPTAEDLVLIVDQFEEVFTLCSDPMERDWFITALVTAATTPTSRTRVVIGVRADFYGRCGDWPELVTALQDNQVLVPAMTSDQLRSAIVQPAVRGGYTVETALVARLVADTVGQPAVLPMLSHVLLETWRRRRGTTLTLTSYDAAGGLEHAVTRTAESAYTHLNPPQQDLARQLFLRLTALDHTAETAKRRIHRDELDTENPNTITVLETLARARLITLDRDHVDLAHEALIRCWPRLRTWLDDNHDGLRIHRALTDATTAWESLHHDDDALYRGARLALADDWSHRNQDLLTPREQRFLDASLTAQTNNQRATRRRTHRLRVLTAVLAVLLVVTSTTVVLTVRAQRETTHQHTNAIIQQAIAAANKLAYTDPALAIQIRLAVYRLDPTPPAWDSLRTSFLFPYSELGGRATAIAFTPNSHILASTSDTIVQLSNISYPYAPQDLGIVTGHTANVWTIAISPNGDVMATGSADHTVRLWDITDPIIPTALATITTHNDAITSMAFDPTGRVLATTSYDRTLRLWDLTKPKQPAELATIMDSDVDLSGDNEFNRYDAVGISPNGHLLTAVSTSHTIHLWNIDDPRHPAPIGTATNQNGISNAVAFSPDSRILATASLNGPTLLWDVTDMRRPLASVGSPHGAWGLDVAFSHDGHWLATNTDISIEIWDISDPRQPRTKGPLIGHPPDRYLAISFSPDDTMLAEATRNGTVRLDDIHPFTAPNTNNIIALICRHASPTITQTQWEQNFPGMAYQPPCR